MGSPPPPAERTLDEIIKEVERFRILVVGRAGVGKSSLINRVFGSEVAPVEDQEVGDADIEREFVSKENKLFVLHDSKGFEPGDLESFNTVRKFVEGRSQKPFLKDRIHGIWHCVEATPAGGRVFETGDERLLEFAHEKGVPLVLVFTQYDRLVKTKEIQLQGRKSIKNTDLPRRIVEEANKAFKTCLESLNLKSGTPMPTYAKVSVRPGYEEDISYLSEVTGDVAQARVEGDAWVLWAMAQRASLPVKIKACITKGISYYTQAFASSLPLFGRRILRDCLDNVHNDIIACWNFKDEGKVLNSPEFQERMFFLVDDVQTERSAKTPNVDEASKYLTFVKNASPALVPFAGNIGVAVMSAQWLTMSLGENFSEARRLLITYIVDLVNVLIELFNLTLRVDLILTTTWTELREAFEAYQGSSSCQSIHDSIRSKRRWIIEDVGSEISHLLEVDKYYISSS